MRRAVEGALEVAAQDLLGEAARRAPIDEGTLRAAGHVVKVEVGDRVEMRVVFDLVYAEVQHERLDFQHDAGEAKYLENPLKEKGQRYAAALAAAARRAV